MYGEQGGLYGLLGSTYGGRCATCGSLPIEAPVHGQNSTFRAYSPIVCIVSSTGAGLWTNNLFLGTGLTTRAFTDAVRPRGGCVLAGTPVQNDTGGRNP